MKRILSSDYFPRRPIWLVFDQSNGHAPVKRYVWWFDTRQAAREHMKHQRKMKYCAELAGPVKFVPANDSITGGR